MQVVNQGDEKYRRLRLSNPRIAAAIVEVPGALDALLALGWAPDESEPEYLVCPRSAKMTMAEVALLTSLCITYEMLIQGPA